jgi:hypothetical protein
MKQGKVGCGTWSRETETPVVANSDSGRSLAWDEGEDYYERLFEDGKAVWLGAIKSGAGRWNQKAGEIVRNLVVHGFHFPDSEGCGQGWLFDGFNYITLENPTLSFDMCAYIVPRYAQEDIIATVVVKPRKGTS